MNALIILFYRIVTFFTRVPSKTRALHTKLRASKLAETDVLNSYFINRQYDLSDIPYGAGDLGINGCGPIALYNAIKALDKSDTSSNLNFSSIVDYMEMKGAAFRGRLGTAPHIINRYLKLSGFSTSSVISKDSCKLNKFSENFDAFISLIFNDSGSLKKGLHFICVSKNAYGGFTSHNPERTGETLYDTLNKCSDFKIRHVYTIGIKGKENE